ncbi:MAG: T9SS type A sorting domain-containing protein, partial [Bacteroidota bacterium]
GADGIECHAIGFTTTRYLQFTFRSRNAKIREIELYGTVPNRITCPPDLNTCITTRDCDCPRLPMEEFIGSNTNIDIPAEKVNAVGFVRNYQHTFFNEGYHDPDYPPYPNNQYTWSPTSRSEYDHDQFYQAIFDLGVGICADVHKAPAYLTTFAYKNNNPDYTVANAIEEGLLSDEQIFVKVIERKPFDETRYPITVDLELTDPNAYVEHADVLYQLASRYGNSTNNPNLKVASNNQAKSGLGLIQYVENWNEPDKWWHFFLVQNESYLDPYVEQRLGYFTPFEYAAMSSAGYDGNGKTNGIENVVRARYPGNIPPGAGPVGLESSNSGLKFAMCGLTEINLDYVRAVKFWFEHYRPDIEFPFEAINFHHYSHNGNLGQQQQYGISPEEDGLRERIRKAVDFRDQYLPGVEVWLSEFGYDTNPNSIQSPDCSRFCSDCNSPQCFEKMREIQGQWVVRAFMEIAAGGADRAMVFSMRDGNPETDGTIYSSAGLNTFGGPDEDIFDSKTGWYYVSTFKKVTEGLRFDPTFQHDDPAVRLYRFVDDCNNPERTVYAAWSPTSTLGDDRPIISNYQLPISADGASLIQMTDGDVDGVKSTPRQCNGQVCVDISERPKFIVLGEAKDVFQACDCPYLSFEPSGSGNTAALGDEQAIATDLYCGEGAAMQSAWEGNTGQEVLIDLQDMARIDHLFMFSDNSSSGQIDIYTGAPGDWRFFASWDVFTPRPNKWKSFADVNRNTRYIRLVARQDGIRIGEVKVCGQSSRTPPPSCNDGIQNGNETGIDCGGSCPACPTCSDGIQNGNETGVDCGGNCAPCSDNSCLVPLRPNMFFQENGQSAQAGNFAGSLADEQNTMGDPINGQGTEVNTAWQDPWGAGVKAYVDLGQVYDLSSFHFFDGFGEGMFEVSTGQPADANPPFIRFNANSWPPQWVGFSGPNYEVQTRYLTFTRIDPAAKINEMAICGVPADDRIPTCEDGIQNGNETGVDCGGDCPPCPLEGCQINLRPEMFFTADGQSDAAINFGGSLADEQDDMGDPINGQGVEVNTPWQFPWGSDRQVYVDLGQVYDLSSFHFFDGFGEGMFEVSTGRPADGNAPFIRFNANHWPPQWIDFSGPNYAVRTQYLTFTRVDPAAKINEIALCGQVADDPTPTCHDGIQNGRETGVDCGGICPPCPTFDCRIPLSPEQFFNEFGQADPNANFAGSLADEQSDMGDPINGQGTTVAIPWQYPWTDNVKAYVDLGQTYELSSIALYDGFGTGRFQIATGLPDAATPAFLDFNADQWPPAWRLFDLEGQNIQARYLTFTRVDPAAKINEISICGTAVPASLRLGTTSQTSTECHFKVFPNPARDQLQLQSEQTLEGQLKIVDLQGKVVMERSLQHELVSHIDIDHLHNGMYILFLEGVDGCKRPIQRFVKLP